METNFKPICIYVTYNTNQLTIDVPMTGITTKELLRIVCAKLELLPNKCHIVYNGNVQQDDTLICPFSRVVLSETSQPIQPNLQQCLWQIASFQRGGKDIETFKMLGTEIFEEMSSHMQRMAHYGQLKTTIHFPQSLEDYSPALFIPPTWIRVLRIFYELRAKILKFTRDACHAEGMFPTIVEDAWTFSWRVNHTEMVITRVTARDLVQMGYKASDGDLFRRIMNRLRGAVMTGEVSADYLEPQKSWVKKHFPI